MSSPIPRIDAEVLAAALFDTGADRGAGLAPAVMRDLVRRYMAHPETRSRLVNAVVQHSANEEPENLAAFGPVAAEGGTYDDPAQLMLDPIGSPEFDAGLDLLLQFDETPTGEPEESQPKVNIYRPRY